MKKRMIAVLLISILLISPIILAQEQAQTYSGFNKFIDNVKMFFSGGDNKVRLALEIREKQVDSAIEKAKAGNTEEAIKSLEDARKKLKIVQEKTSSDAAEKVKKNVDEITEKITENKNINPEFDKYLDEYLKEEEKTKLSAEHSEKLFDYCDELAKQGYELMLQDEKCNPDNAPDWLEDKIDDKIEEYEEESAEKMLEIFTTCINDPRECDCSEIPIASEKTKCEKGKALAIRCEFQNDESACKELSTIDIEIPSNLPGFLKPFFRKKIENVIREKEKEMFGKHAPPECVEAGVETREECEAIMMEKYAPSECIAAGAATKEECDKIMFSIHGAPPNECMENGEFIGEELCNEKLISSGMIPKECVKDGMPVSKEECQSIMEEKGMMGPPECKGFSKEECDHLMREKGMTQPLIKCEGISEEECRILMEEQGIIMAPPECKGLGEEECNRLIIERGLIPQGMTDPKVAPGKEFKIPQECVGMSFQECEDYLMGNYMPQDCMDAGALTPESCKQVILPEECKQAGALRPEECGAIMIKKGMPQECQDAGVYDFFKCAKILYKKVSHMSIKGEVEYLEGKGISLEEIPEECLEGSNFVRSMECDEALVEEFGIMLPPPVDTSTIPRECMRDGTPVSPEECEEILGGAIMQDFVPEECRKAGITDPEKCGRLLNKIRKNAGMGMQDLPPECYTMSVLECKIFMDEHGMEPIDVMGIMKGRGEKPPKQKCEREECDQPQCTDGQVKMRSCPEGIEVVDGECINGEWVGLDIACQKPVEKEKICCKLSELIADVMPTYKWMNQDECQIIEDESGQIREVVSDEYCEGEKSECVEGEETTIMCDSGIEITDCICKNGMLACIDAVCPIFKNETEKPCEGPEGCEGILIHRPIECFEMGIEDDLACSIVMSKINEERIKNGDKMIIDEDGEKDYITNEQIDKIADEAEKKADEYEPDLEDAEEIKEELEDIEEEIKEIDEGLFRHHPPEGELSGERQEAGASESGSDSGGESGGGSAVTGEVIRNSNSNNPIKKIFNWLF